MYLVTVSYYNHMTTRLLDVRLHIMCNSERVLACILTRLGVKYLLI